MSRSAKLTLAVAVLAVVLIPVAAVASHQFTDVPDGNIFHGDIAWMRDNNVTKGCNPPANDKYCPGTTVTREQMAAFMRRLAVNKVVDAKTAVTADTATTANNADKLDGLHANQLTIIDGAIGDSVAGIGTAQTVVQMTVQAPTAGLLAITGSVALEDADMGG